MNLDWSEVESPGPVHAEIGLLLIQPRQQVKQDPLPSFRIDQVQRVIGSDEVESFPTRRKVFH
jgi:hypothetical protein